MVEGYDTVAALGDRIEEMEKEIQEVRKSQQEKTRKREILSI
ncbi:MAG TPA: hypothetical protein VKA91_02075 [Nitrososphaeraceae archaeon]|nr:hypothetical protein [Nitrososphaeraceae archaeon]